jgi:restriction system protein
MKAWNHQELAQPLREHFVGSICPYCATRTISVNDAPEVVIPDADEVSDTSSFDYCPVCGWWVVHHHVTASFGESHPYSENSWHRRNYGIAGALRNLDLEDLSVPINEVRSFLAAKWQSRFNLHPRLFEEVVGSVFKSLGYRARVTSYSGDGGIDVVLDSPEDKTVGVQVKRWRNRIKVEQIRSFVGAYI